MRVREIMTPERTVVAIASDATVARAAELLLQRGIGALPVLENGVPIGLLAERDVVRALAEFPAGILQRPVHRVMRRPPPTCGPDDTLSDVMARMTRERARHFVVVESGKLAGMLSVGDLVKHRLDELEVEAGVLRDYVAAQRSRF